MQKDIQKLNITYSGDGIINGEIDLESFATSILNFGKALSVIRSHLCIENIDIKIIVTKEGSFEVDLALIQSGWESFKSLFSSPETNAIATVITIFGGVISLYSHLKGEKSKKIEQKGDNIFITNINNDTLVFNQTIVNIYEDTKFREGIESFVKSPLDTESIDKITIKHNDELLEIDKSEKEFYKKNLLTKDEYTQTRVYTQTFTIVTLAFEKNNKWKLADARGVISASIKDEVFLNRIESGEIQFAKGDRLICEVELVEDFNEEKIKSTYTILEIKEHIKSPKVGRLPGLE